MSNFLFKKGYLDEIVGWQFFNRSSGRFPVGYARELKRQIESWQDLRFFEEDLDYLSKAMYWLDRHYVYSYLKSYEFDTSPIKIHFKNAGGYEEVAVSYEGEWGKVIFFEIYLLSVMSELYGIMNNMNVHCLNDKELKERNKLKITQIADCGAKVSEFGTRRRYSKENQDAVIAQIKEIAPEMLNGTSNAYFARKYGLTPMGTMGHELVMYMGAKYGPTMADKILMKEWVDVYQGALGIYLPDTYTTKRFLEVFDLLNSKLWDGVREDSAPDTDAYVDTVIAHYKKLRIDPTSKMIVHSNGISNADKLIHMQNYRRGEIGRSFGLGTWLTHDVYTNESGVEPMDWVAKMTHIYENGRKRYCVKISDMPGKITSSDPLTVQLYLNYLGIAN
jgi:nicotinate phosphoribosyltransferase